MRIPFAIQAYQSRSLPVMAQQTINFYAEKMPSDAKAQIVLMNTPGLRLHSGLGSGPIRGMADFHGSLFVLSGTDLYQVMENGSASVVGTVPAAGDVYMESNAEQLGVLVGASLYIWDGSTLALVTDVDYPGWGSFCALDGYFIGTLPDSDQFSISDLDDGTAHDGGDVASAEGSPDHLVRAFKDHRELWLFGRQTTEVWYNSGATDFPFARVDGGFMEKGLLAAKLVAKNDNSVFWVGNDRIVYRADGFRPQRVSTHAIEKILRELETVSDGYSLTYVQDGHTFICFTFPTSGATIVLDAATNLWHERKSYGLDYWRACCHVPIFGKLLVGDHINGNVYELDLDHFWENEDPIIRVATSAPIDANGKRISMATLDMSMETGVGLTTGQGSDPQAMLSWSDDDGRTFGIERWASIGRIGEYKKRLRWNRLGSFRTRIYRLSVSDPVKSIVIGIGDDG
jgi:hypothetical protein